ncbi:major facilitator superfamily protein [Actinidia rufa]|uniref:Major facilitator superfamily protein n=2 Tax=Magnoliopsida TaxID=3398 RepID=A0A7J0FLN3_9ERIC|nr:major facilitator superfamily protein [Actinidia rufa]
MWAAAGIRQPIVPVQISLTAHSAPKIIIYFTDNKPPSSHLRRRSPPQRRFRVWSADKQQLPPLQSPEQPDDEATSLQEKDNSGVDLGWLPAFPHVLVASMSNFLFGYHIGVMNGPIVSIARELGFEGNSFLEGLVVSIFIASAFIGSISCGSLVDKLGCRRTFQVITIPLILGAIVSAQAHSLDEILWGRFLVGLGIGVNTVLVPIYISERGCSWSASSASAAGGGSAVTGILCLGVSALCSPLAALAGPGCLLQPPAAPSCDLPLGLKQRRNKPKAPNGQRRRNIDGKGHTRSPTTKDCMRHQGAAGSSQEDARISRRLQEAPRISKRLQEALRGCRKLQEYPGGSRKLQETAGSHVQPPLTPGFRLTTSLLPLLKVAPTKYRGSLGTLCQIGTCLGIIASLFLGIPSENDPHWWRTILYIASVPGFILSLGKVEDAKEVISNLWGQSEVNKALEEFQSVIRNDGGDLESTWLELLEQPHSRGCIKSQISVLAAAAFIGGALFVLQQFAGINGVLYFSSLTFQDVGITNGALASLYVGITNFAGALCALYLMDKQGRKRLLMGSYFGMAISMFLIVYAISSPIDEELSHSLSILGTILYIFTFAIGAGPVTGLIIPEISSNRTRAKIMGFSFSVHWVCNFLVGLFFLELVEKLGVAPVYATFGGVSLLAATFAYYFTVETKGRSLEEIEIPITRPLQFRLEATRHGWGKKPIRRLGGMSDALSIAADLGFSVPPPPLQEEIQNLSTNGEKGDDLIRALRELTTVQRKIADLQVELQGRKEDKNVAHLTHDRIIARLQQPYSLDCIPVEAEFQKQFSELLMKAASDYGALTASVGDFQWSQNFKEPPSVWGEMLRPIPVALASCTRFFEAMSAMRESFSALQNLRVGHSSSSLTVTPAKDSSQRTLGNSECVTPPPWRNESSFDDIALRSLRGQEADDENSEVGDTHPVDSTSHRRLSWPPSVKKNGL